MPSVDRIRAEDGPGAGRPDDLLSGWTHRRPEAEPGRAEGSPGRSWWLLPTGRCRGPDDPGGGQRWSKWISPRPSATGSRTVCSGRPIASDRQSSERLGKPTALAVLSSDVISSSAYATEQMLIPLVLAIGAAAYSLVIPMTLAVIFVLLFVTLSYLEVVKVYTKAGGAYVVARENFGLTVAQVAAMSLLIDYTLTVAVSVAAGVAAITSVVPGADP